MGRAPQEDTPREGVSRWTNLVNFDAIPMFARGPSALTLAVTMFAQGLLVVSGIIVARALGVEGRGSLAFLWLVPLAITLLGGIGIPQATTYYVAREESNPAAVVGLSIRITLGLAAILLIAYGAAMATMGDIGGSYSGFDAALSVGMIIPFMALNLGIAVLLGLKNFKAFNLSRVMAPLFYASGSAVLLATGAATLSTVLAVAVSSWLAAAGSAWLIVHRDLKSTGRAPSTGSRQIVGFGLRGVIGSTSTIDDVRLDQVLVGVLMDARALGIYVVAIAFCNLPRFVAQSIGSVAFPRIASAGSEAAGWALAIRATRVGILTIAGVVALLLLALPLLVPLLFGDAFRDSIELGRILLVAAFFLSVHRLLTELARGLGHPGYGSITEAVNGVVFILGVLLLATPATTEGVAGAVLAGGIACASVLSFLLLRLRRRSVTQAGAGH